MKLHSPTKTSLKYEELKDIGLPLKNIMGIKALSPKNSFFYFYVTPKEILNFFLFTHEEFKRSISHVYQAFVRG